MVEAGGLTGFWTFVLSWIIFLPLSICLGSKSLVLKNSFSFCACPYESEKFLCLQLIQGQQPSLSISSPVNLPPFSISRTPRIKSPLCVPLAKHCQTPKRTEQSVMAFVKYDYGRKRDVSHFGDEKYSHWESVCVKDNKWIHILICAYFYSNAPGWAPLRGNNVLVC